MAFIFIQFGDNEELMMNPNCRQLIFMNYLREKCQYDKGAIIDLIDENGNLSNIHQAKKDEDVSPRFEERTNYIPVMLEKGSDDNTLKKVKPLLNDWEKRFPQLERKIKILTGEVKRKSPVKGTLDVRGGRGVDRKTSKHLDKSLSNMARPSVTQSGRFSSARLSAQPSVSGRGSAGKTEKKGGSKGAKGKKK